MNNTVIRPIKYDDLAEIQIWCIRNCDVIPAIAAEYSLYIKKPQFKLYRCHSPWDIFSIDFKSEEEKIAFMMRFPFDESEWLKK